MIHSENAFRKYFVDEFVFSSHWDSSNLFMTSTTLIIEIKHWVPFEQTVSEDLRKTKTLNSGFNIDVLNWFCVVVLDDDNILFT